jgi:coenzyme PQQ precursor peptide PqqA
VVRRSEGEATMRWEVPQAIDFRFGMEITLYIARR